MKRREEGFGLVEGLLLLVTIGLLVALGWMFFSKQNSTTNVDNKVNVTKDTKDTPALQPEDVTAKLKSNYSGKYTLLNIDDNNQPKSGQMSVRLSKRAPAYKTDGYNFYTDYDGGSMLDLMAGPVNWATHLVPRQIDITVRTEVADVYKGFGLAKTGTRGNKDFGTETDVYVGKGLICVIESPKAPTSSTSASCGRIDAYKDAAEKIKPFASTIPEVSSSTMLSNLKITDSLVSGYQKATISMGNLSLKTSPNERKSAMLFLVSD